MNKQRNLHIYNSYSNLCGNPKAIKKMLIKNEQNSKNFKFTNIANITNSSIARNCNLNYFIRYWKHRDLKTFNKLKYHKYSSQPNGCTMRLEEKINNVHNWTNMQYYNLQEGYFKSSGYGVFDTDTNSSGNINIDTKIESAKFKSKVNKPDCWLFQKYTHLLNRYHLAIIFVNIFPRLKIFIIVRNPTDREVSQLHFGQTNIKLTGQNIESIHNMTREEFIFEKKYIGKNSQDMKTNLIIDEQCLQFVQDLKILQFKSDVENVDCDEILFVYKKMAVQLLKQKYMNTTQTMNSNRLAPKIIYWTYIYDEKFGYRNWNQFRIVQFDWLYRNLTQSMGVIKCWLQMNKQFDENNVDVDVDDIDLFQQCGEIYFNDLEYFKSVNRKLINESHIKVAHAKYDKDPLTLQDRKNFNSIYYPCNRALDALIETRKEILLGNWIPWDLEIDTNLIIERLGYKYMVSMAATHINSSFDVRLR